MESWRVEGPDGLDSPAVIRTCSWWWWKCIATPPAPPPPPLHLTLILHRLYFVIKLMLRGHSANTIHCKGVGGERKGEEC